MMVLIKLNLLSNLCCAALSGKIIIYWLVKEKQFFFLYICTEETMFFKTVFFNLQ